MPGAVMCPLAMREASAAGTGALYWCPYTLAAVAVAMSREPPRMSQPQQTEVRMDARQLWQAALGDLETRLSRGHFENWLRKTQHVGIEDNLATVAAPT